MSDTPPVLRRLKTRAQFLAVAKGLSCARGAVMIQRLPSGDPATIGEGFTATRKIGGAVVRNRAKRRMREAARALLPLHGEAGHDYVMVARSGVVERPWDRLLDDMRNALQSLAAGDGQPPRPRAARSKGRARTPLPGKTA